MHFRSQKLEEERALMESAKAQQALWTKSNKLALKLKASEDAYFARKRASQLADISEGEAKVGRNIEFLDPISKLWRHYKILECKVEWIDNGTKSKLVYVAQEFNKDYEEIGDPVEIDLAGQRFYETDNVYIDEEAIEQQKQQRIWEARLQEIEDDANKRIVSLHTELDNFISREEQIFKKLNPN